MAPKKDAVAPETTITGYDTKETRILAAAFVSSLGSDKVRQDFTTSRNRPWFHIRKQNITNKRQYDFPLFAKLTGFTEGTMKKFWPPVKKKAMEEHPEFAKFITGNTAPPAAKSAGGKKRKAIEAGVDADADADGDATEGKGKKAAKSKRGNKVKSDEAEELKREDSADGDDGKGEFPRRHYVLDWLDRTDGCAEEV